MSVDNAKMLKYTLSYDDKLLPPKTSFAQDHWGYYNGTNNISLIPDSNSYNLLTCFKQFLKNGKLKCGNRNTNPKYITAASLKSITFPII